MEAGHTMAREPIALYVHDNDVLDTNTVPRDFVAPAIETTTGELLHTPVEDKEELLERALEATKALNKDLEQQITAFIQQESNDPSAFRPDVRNSRAGILSFQRALDMTQAGDWSTLEKWGLRVDPGWFNDIVRSMLKGRPVEFEAAKVRKPYVLSEEEDGDTLAYDDLFTYQEAGLKFGELLQRTFEYTRPVVMVNDLVTSALHQQHILRVTHATMQDNDLINESSQPGKDFVVVPASRGLERFDQLMESLRESDGIVLSHDKRAFLQPSERVSQSVMRNHYFKTDSLRQYGVLLQDTEGKPTQAAIDAANYLDPINKAFTHFRMQSARYSQPRGGYLAWSPYDASDKLSMLLQTLDRVYPDRESDIYYDESSLSAPVVHYALTWLLRNELEKIAQSLRELDDVQVVMKPRDYFNHNYNSEKGIWPEDIQGISVIGRELPRYYEPGDIKSATIIGYGPFSYPALGIAPFMRSGARINISDLLPDNIEFAQEWFNDTADDAHNDVYFRFAEQFRQCDPKLGHLYKNCEEELRAAGDLCVAKLEDLPSDSAQLLAESFVSCSNNVEKYGFYESVRQKARILKWTPRSMMVSVHMMGSGGWNNSGDDEGIKIPAANLSMTDIEDAYRCAGLRIVRSVPLHSNSKFREDYQGMVAIFAVPDTPERPTSIPS